VGKTHWRRRFQEADLLAGPQDAERNWRGWENGILRQERDLPEKATAFFTKETSR
jgi:hypothetical protein